MYRFLIGIAIVWGLSVRVTQAQETAQFNEKFFKAEVVRVENKTTSQELGSRPFQIVEVKFLDGELAGEVRSIEHGTQFSLDDLQMVKPRQSVVVVQTQFEDENITLQIIDTYRLDAVLPIILGFFVVVVTLSRWHGVGSIIGLGVSLAVITQFVVPRILAGDQPLVVSIVGCIVIMVFTLYLAHGVRRQTTVALVSTAITLTITGLLAGLFVAVTRLSGLGSDEAVALRFGEAAGVQFQGLLLGGMLIGALGVLDDVTTSLAATVFEIYKANPRQTFPNLVSAGLAVGREHVSSLVNTLAMAYAGASMPVFLTLVLNPSKYPVWTILNSEMLMEEIVRTLAGGFGLILAVPITTFIAAGYLTGKFGKKS